MMTRRETWAAVVVVLAIAATYTAAVLAQDGAGIPHERYHPQWLRDSGCCGPADCYRARVRYTPAGWQVLALRLRPTDPWRPPPRPIVVPIDKASPSRDGHFWICFYMDGGAPGAVRSYGYPKSRLCFFQPLSGQ